MKLEVAIEAAAVVGEGPCWDARNQRLLWVDILGMQVHSFDPKSGRNQTIQLDQLVGTVAVRASGGLIVALRDGIYALDEETGNLQLLAAPASHPTGNRFNDGKCDPTGRFWAGTMSLDKAPNAGFLYRMDIDKRTDAVLDGLTIANGLAWSPDRTTMYVNDTPTMLIEAYGFDPIDGLLGRKQAELRIEPPGVPDGMTIDEEGCLWIAHFGGSRVTRWNPYTGQCIDEIQLPVSQCTSCVFGGTHLDELYITSARIRLSEEELKKQPTAGSVFKVKLPVKGSLSFEYKG